MATYGDLRSWNAAGVSSAGTDLRGDLTTLEKARDELEASGVPDSWTGLSASFAGWRKASLVEQMRTHLEGAGAFERAVFDASSEVAAIRRTVDEIDTDAGAQEFSISGDGTVTDVTPPEQFVSLRAAESHTEQRVALRDALMSRIEQVLRRATELDTTLLWALPHESFSDGEDEVADPGGMGGHDWLTGPVSLDDSAFDLSSVMQGQIGDCWFISSAGAVGATDPDWIRDHIRYNADGSYTVTLYDEDGHEVGVRVDASLIEKGVRNSGDGSPSWLSVYEKAAASYAGGSYGDIDSDSIARGLSMVTGRHVDSDGDMSIDDIRAGIDDGRIHVVSTEDDSDSWINPFDTSIDDDNVVPNHAYIIDRVEDHDGDGDLEVHVVNPWGPDGGDFDGHHRSGDLWLTEDEFHESFDTTYSIGRP
jgi:hypothetical protein